MADSNTKTLEAKCSCGSVHFTIDVPKSLLPLSVHLCQCSLCRFATGGPCVFHAHLPKGLKPNFIAPSTESNLTVYSFEGGECTYDFCSTCGCHIAGVGLDREEWTISTSIFTDYRPENFQITKLSFTKSAKDGGIAQFLSHLGGREVDVWNPPDDSPRAKVVESTPEVGEDGTERLRAQCHCGGVSFAIKRPTKEAADDEFFGSFVYPDEDRNKWFATFDVCNDCRLINGNHVNGWTFLPTSFCEPHIKSDLKIGTTKTYSSSPGVLRGFCGTCGATIFFSTASRNFSEERHVIDVSVGILRAPEGYMAENWIGWRSRLAFADDGKGFDKDFTESLEEGMKKYVVRKIGRELTMNIG